MAAEMESQPQPRKSALPPLEELRPSSVVRGFRDFLSNYGVIPLAIGVVMGSAVNDLVKTLVDGIITPFISLVTPNGRLQGWEVTVHGAVFKFGAVLNSALSFICICAVVYIVAKFFLRNEELIGKKK